MTAVLRCRFAGRSVGFRVRQCDHPAKGERLVDFEAGATLPACGIHLRVAYANEYRPYGRELPVRKEIIR